MSLDYMTLAWRTELQAGPRLILRCTLKEFW